MLKFKAVQTSAVQTSAVQTSAVQTSAVHIIKLLELAVAEEQLLIA